MTTFGRVPFPVSVWNGVRVPLGRPDATSLPAAIWIVDAAIHPFGIEAEGVGDAEIDPVPADEREERLVGIAGRDRHVPAEPEDIVLVDPAVIARLGGAR